MRKSLPKTPRSAPSSTAASLRGALLADAGHRRAVSGNGGLTRGNGAVTARAPVSVGAAAEAPFGARLRLLEGFVARAEVADCAQYGLQWLGEVLRVPQSLCLVRPTGEQTLFTVGTYGLATSTANPFTV